ncbi:hypothetical protein R3P38DRAFT_619600 [Favolaschia claudopus]|uniref:Secreted protein n=1 Tax=Favolaschia claudopus TaxID=2862362 RepID=A0AAW0CCV7_9AGAR
MTPAALCLLFVTLLIPATFQYLHLRTLSPSFVAARLASLTQPFSGPSLLMGNDWSCRPHTLQRHFDLVSGAQHSSPKERYSRLSVDEGNQGSDARRDMRRREDESTTRLLGILRCRCCRGSAMKRRNEGVGGGKLRCRRWRYRVWVGQARQAANGEPFLALRLPASSLWCHSSRYVVG